MKFRITTNGEQYRIEYEHTSMFRRRVSWRAWENTVYYSPEEAMDRLRHMRAIFSPWVPFVKPIED